MTQKHSEIQAPEEAQILSEVEKLDFESLSVYHQAVVDAQKQLEKLPDVEALDAVFRAVHSIKGSAGFANLPYIEKLTHNIEAVLSEVRRSLQEYSPELQALLSESLAFLKSIFFGDAPVNSPGYDALIDKLGKCHNEKPDEEVQLPRGTDSQAAEPKALTDAEINIMLSYYSDFDAEVQDLLSDLSVEKFEALQTKLENTHYLAQKSNKTKIVELASFLLRILSFLREGDSSVKSEVFAVVSDGFELLSTLISLLGMDVPDASIDTRKVTDTFRSVLRKNSDCIGENKNKLWDEAGVGDTFTLRISAASIEQLVDQFALFKSEYEILDEFARKNDLPTQLVKQMGLLYSRQEDLEEKIYSLKRFSISDLFYHKSRLLKNFAEKTNKKIKLTIKASSDIRISAHALSLIDPILVHLLRNCFDHGIETPEERILKGKRVTGEILLKACEEGEELVIIVQDDGSGFNEEKILATAKKHGLIDEGSYSVNAENTQKLVFKPGLSTATGVSLISGRGMGMSAVQKNVEKANGTVEVSSQTDIGTRITCRFPQGV